MLTDRFLNELKKSGLTTSDDKIVVGVSGGIDSITLISLLAECGFNVSIAHCNFSLRGKESDGDEQFVKEFALKNGITFHSIKFDTHKEAEQSGESIQITARRLRYDWFEVLCTEHRYTKIAIAHNSDDTVETFFINLTRGTGIKGLTGIPECRGKVVRPLMFATRKEIEQYAELRGIPHREDHTNSSIKYMRNKIRHLITPVFRELNDDFNTTMRANMENIEDSYNLLKHHIGEIEHKSVTIRSEQITVNFTPIATTPKPSYTLFEIIRQWGFSAEQSEDIVRALSHGKSGVTFVSKDFEAITDRNNILIERTNLKIEDKEITLEENCEKEFDGVLYTTSTRDKEQTEELKTEPDTAIFDHSLLTFPLTVRHIKEGDRMHPFGMRGSKKISDILTDKKMSLFDKKRQTVIINSDEIIWLTKIRSSENFKVSEKSRKLVVIKVSKKQTT